MIKKLLNYTIIAIFSFLFLSCEKDDPVISDKGRLFGKQLNMKFYFTDGVNDLIDLKNFPLLPFSYKESIVLPDSVGKKDSLSYSYNNCTISYNNEKNQYYWTTYIYGYKEYIRNEFYVYITEADTDTFNVTFRYTENAETGEILPNIDTLTYNGTIIRSGENTPDEFAPEHIFITKSLGETTVSFEE